jgi:hypothetical protein
MPYNSSIVELYDDNKFIIVENNIQYDNKYIYQIYNLIPSNEIVMLWDCRMIRK